MAQKKRKRVRWGRVIIALLFSSIFTVGLFTIFHYIQGTLKVINQPLIRAEENHDFLGEEQTKKGDPINVLLLGSDSRGKEQARTDTIMVARYEPLTHKVKLVSLMRDMLVTVPEYGEQKLNAAFTYGGPELLRETIKENFDLNLQYYAMIDFKGFEKAVTLLVPNGIEVEIPYEMSDGIDMTLEPGKQQLHGKELLGYVRFRQDRLSDFGRVQRQQEVLGKLKDEAVSLQSVTKLPDLIDLLNTYVETNINTATILTIGKDLLTNKTGDIQTLRIPEDGSFQNKRHEMLGEVLDVDFDQTKETLNQFLGE